MKINQQKYAIRSILFVGSLLLLISCASSSNPSSWQILYEAEGISFRGIDAVNESVCWVSGNQGTILRTADGGLNWQDVSVPGADTLDFRDIHAFNENTAVAMSIGSGENSRLYRTSNGGATWDLVYQNSHENGFYDAIAFWDNNIGVLQGDPIDGKLFILLTDDGGRTWYEIDHQLMPDIADGEYAFAASGTQLITAPGGHAWIGTGGVKSRILHSDDYGHTWKSISSPIIQGEASTGIFSLVFGSPSLGIAVGGDYTKEEEGTDNVIISENGGETWDLLSEAELDYRSSIQFAEGVFLTVGPSGSDYSTDQGMTWTPISGPGFHTLSIGSDGLRSTWAAGSGGRIGKLILDPNP